MICNTPALETPRLILRRFTPEDVPALYEIHRDEEVNRFLPWFPVKSLEEAAEFYRRRYETAYAAPRGYAYAICLKEDNVPIGYIGMDAEEPYDLGYGLRKEFWHRGIVTEAAKAVAEQARRDGVPFITATHDVKNPRSGGDSYEEHWMPKDIMVVYRMYQLNLDGQDDRLYRGYWEMFENHFVEDI